MLPIIFAMFALLPSHTFTLTTYYVIYPNGTFNSSWQNVHNLTGFLTGVGAGTFNLVGWATAIIPFIIILVGLGYALQDVFPAGMVASIVAASISVLGTGIGNPPFISDLELYLFIALTLIFAAITFAKGILNPYGN